MRIVPVLLLMGCVAGCAALPDRWRPGETGGGDDGLSAEVEHLLDQPFIDPLTRFLEQHLSQADTRSYQKIARERDSRCRAIGTRYARQAATAQTLRSLRNGYQYSCPTQVEAFARRVPSTPASDAPADLRPAAPPPTSRPPLPPEASDCYLLFTIRNYQRALPACSAAARAGDGQSQHHLASLLRHNRALTDALYWAEQSAAKGYPPGQLLLAEFYQRGHGAPGDTDRALGLIEAAANQGLAEAQYQAGMAWLNGVGTEADHAVALRWLERAAGRDNIAAQLQLAELHFDGPAAQQPSARQWLHRAAVLGSATAQYRLGTSYMEGRGGPADPLDAYVWLSVALLNGEQRASSDIQQLAGRLSPSQLETARQRINAVSQGHSYRD